MRRDYRWKEYGKVIEVKNGTIANFSKGVITFIVFDESRQLLEDSGDWGYVQPDGSLLLASENALSVPKLWFMSEKGFRYATANGIGPEWRQYDASQEADYLASNREVDEASARSSREFWGNMAAGIAVASQATREAAAEQAALAASRQRKLPTVQETLAASDARMAQNQARQQQAHQQRATAARTPQPPGQSLQAANLEIQGLERQRIAQEQQYRQQAQASTANANLAQTPPAVRRRAYPEAVTVCTKPSGAKQSFECRSPLNVQRGHAEDISGHRTPEALASGEACPDMRRLASSTHLVWGCGFGATGANNALDRSAGVDIKGRKTFYCTEREFSCRRTEP